MEISLGAKISSTPRELYSGSIHNSCKYLHRLTATAYRRLMDEQRQTWREVSAVPAAR
jgi:hypothetical protein